MKNFDKMVEIVVHLRNIFLFDNKIDIDMLTDTRIVCADLEHVFGNHCDTGHNESYDKYIALHLNPWVSHDYVTRDSEYELWMKYAHGKPIRHKEENVVGRFG